MTATKEEIARHLEWAVRQVEDARNCGTMEQRRARAELRYWLDREALERERLITAGLARPADGVRHDGHG